MGTEAGMLELEEGFSGASSDISLGVAIGKLFYDVNDCSWIVFLLMDLNWEHSTDSMFIKHPHLVR